MDQKSDRHVFFDNLDGLRFISFFYVFLAHSFPTSDPVIYNSHWYRFFKGRIFFDGEPGVSFFFVLSGFLITYLLLQERSFTNKINLKLFYIRRILRIWPLYYFSVFFGFIIFPILKQAFGGTPNESANFFLSSTFLNNFDRILHGNPDSSILSVLWSVAIEEQFYLIWPLLFIIIPPKYYSFIFIFMIEISILYRITNTTGHIDLNSLGVVSDMALGGLAAWLVKRNSKVNERIRNSHPSFNLIPYFLVVFYLLFKEELFISPILIVHRRIFLGSLFAWIILEQNYCQRSYFKISEFKIVSRLGKYTYGLYCLHTIALLITITLLTKLGLHSQSWHMWLLELPIALGLSVYLSYLSYHYFESYFLRLKKKFEVFKEKEILKAVD